MLNNIKLITQKLGIDRAISFTLVTQLLTTARNVVAIVLVIKFLTATEQGFYYTFTSILAIQIFFELGFSGIITQYAAHEVANLRWDANVLTGNEVHQSRLNSLLHLTTKWFSVMAILLLITLLIGGFVFFYYFAPKHEEVDWQWPWAMMATTTALSLMVSAALAFYEGLGKVESVAKLRFYSLFVTTTVFFTSLCLGAKLYAYAFTNIAGLSVSTIWLFSPFVKKTFSHIWNYKIRLHIISWRKEIFPYQWKIALSWMSGYFLFQLFNPILFSTVGPKPAGQMGITQAALSGVFGLANSWFSTKVPIFSGYIARKEYKMLDIVFNRTIKQALFVMLSCLFVLFSFYTLFHFYKLDMVERFLPYIPFLLLALASVTLFITNAMATYLRCHKEEPYLVASVCSGIVNLSLMPYTSKHYGITGMILGYLLIVIMGLIWGYCIFVNKKKQWHAL